MYRQPLLEMLARYAQRYPNEAAVAARVRELVEAHEDCFERTCPPGHITASAWVTTPDRQRMVLVHHRKLDAWLQPGGHADGQTDVAAAALREAEEETGLPGLRLVGGPAAEPFDIDVHLIPERRRPDGTMLEPAHEHHDLRFMVLADPDATPVASDESHAVRWFDEASLLAITGEESVLRLWRKARADV